MNDSQRIPKGKFALIFYRTIDSHKVLVKSYVVKLFGKHGTTWCASETKPKENALAHFWRYIGAF